MNEILMAAAEKASRKRDWMVSQAKTKGPTAAFYVGLVYISQAIDHAKTVAASGDEEEAKRAMSRLRNVSEDADYRYKSERNDK